MKNSTFIAAMSLAVVTGLTIGFWPFGASAPGGRPAVASGAAPTAGSGTATTSPSGVPTPSAADALPDPGQGAAPRREATDEGATSGEPKASDAPPTAGPPEPAAG